METITSIGVVDTSRKDNIQFALTYMDYKLQTESALAYELWKRGNLRLAEITSRRMNKIVNEMMHLKA